MAEKGFGVKEVNLIGASGTPTITSPNNLNLNAVNVAISTNASIGGNLTVTGNIGIAGTLTYEDVTNIDSIGIITARTGLKVLAGGANVVGVVTGTAFDGGIKVVAANSVAATVYPVFAGSGATQSGNLDLKTDNSLTYNSLSGELTAVKLTGNGSSLTNLPAANLTGTLPALDGSALTGIAVTEAPVTDYTVTANGSSAYRFHGGGVDETANNPDLYLIRGQKYRFNNTTGSGHPFAIREASGGSAYSNGVTGSQNGIQFFTVPYDAPASLFYQCTIHSGMVGNIYIRGAGGQNTNVGITTFSGMAFFRDDLTVSSSGLAVNIFESTDNHSRFRIKSGSSSLAQLEFADQDDADAGEIRYDHGNDRMTFHVGSNNEKLRLGSSGEIGLSGANYGSSGQVLTSQGSSSAPVWANAGITMADQWRITSSSTLGGSVATLNSNWARVASPSGYGKIGSAMSESSGAFTFPSTGIYLIEFTILLAATSSQRYLGHRVQTSVNNFSSAQTVAESLGHMGISNSFGAYHTSSSSYIFDVTDTSTHKIRFAGVAFTSSATTVIGNANQNSTFATFIRLGDT